MPSLSEMAKTKKVPTLAEMSAKPKSLFSPEDTHISEVSHELAEQQPPYSPYPTISAHEPTIMDKIRSYLHKDRPIAQYGSKYVPVEEKREQQPFRTLAGYGAYQLGKYGTGKALHIPEMIVPDAAEKIARKIAPAMILTPGEKAAGEAMATYGGLGTSSKIVGSLAKKLPVGEMFRLIMRGAGTFGLQSTAKEVSGKVGKGEPIDDKKIIFDTLFGALVGTAEGTFAKGLARYRYNKFIKDFPQAKKIPKSVMLKVDEAFRAAEEGMSKIALRKAYGKHIEKFADIVKKEFGRKAATTAIERVAPSFKPTPEQAVMKEYGDRISERIAKGGPTTGADVKAMVAQGRMELDKALKPPSIVPEKAPEPPPVASKPEISPAPPTEKGEVKKAAIEGFEPDISEKIVTDRAMTTPQQGKTRTEPESSKAAAYPETTKQDKLSQHKKEKYFDYTYQDRLNELEEPTDKQRLHLYWEHNENTAKHIIDELKKRHDIVEVSGKQGSEASYYIDVENNEEEILTIRLSDHPDVYAGGDINLDAESSAKENLETALWHINKEWGQAQPPPTVMQKPREPAGLKELGGVEVPPPGLTKAEAEHLGRREQEALRAGQARGYPIGYKMGKREAVEDARNKMFKYRMATKLSDQLKKDAADIVKQYVPKEKQHAYIKRILEAKTPLRVERISEAVHQYIDKAEHDEAVRGFRKFVQDTHSKYRRGEERLGRLRKDVRDKVVKVLDEYDPSKLTEAKRKVLESRDEYIKRVSETVADAYESLEEDGVDIIQMPNARIRELERLSKTHIGELDSDQIRYIQSSLEHLIAIGERKGLIKDVIRAEKVGKLVNQARQEISPKVKEKGIITENIGIIGGIGKVATTEQASIRTLAGRLSGKDYAATKELLVDEIYKGYRQKAKLLRKFYEAAREEIGKNQKFTNADALKLVKTESVKLGGKTYKIDMDNLLSLYTSIKAEGNLRRLLKTEGLEFTVYGRNPKYLWAINSKTKIMTRKPSLSELRALVELVEAKYPKISKLAESAFKLNREVQGPEINKTSMEFQNYELARKNRYWPIHRVMPKGIEGGKTDISVSIENQGRYLPRTGGTQRIRIVPFTQELVSGIQSDAAFSSMVIPMRNAKALIADKRWQTQLKKQGREAELNALVTMYRRIQGMSTDQSIVEQMGADVLNKFGQSVLSVRLSGMGVQMASVPASYETIEPKYFSKLRGLVTAAHLSDKKVKEMTDLSDILWLRWEARKFNFVTGGLAAQHTFENMILGKQPFTESLLNHYKWGDQKAIWLIYKASQNKVAAETSLKRGTQEFNERAMRITEEALDTQPQWDIVHRSPLTSSPNVLLRGSVMFKSARNAQYNVALRAWDDWRKGRIGFNEFESRIKGVVYANILVSVVKRLIKAGVVVGIGAMLGVSEEKAKTKIKKQVKQIPLDSLLNMMSLPVFGELVQTAAYETVKRIKKPETPIRSHADVRTGNIFTDLSLDVTDLMVGVGLMSRYYISGEKFQSGPDKGKLKWKREAARVGDRLAELIAYRYGLPYTAVKSEVYYPSKSLTNKKKSVYPEGF